MKQKMKSAVRQMLALVLCVAMLLPMLPAFAFATDTSTQTNENVIYLLAGSDYQPRDGSDPDVNMPAILQKIYNAGYTHFDGLLFCGDYTGSINVATDTKTGIAKIKSNLTNAGMTIPEKRMVFIKGNHDPMTDGIAASGAHDTDAYGVFVINEDDYMWKNSDKARIRRTADNLKAYLDNKQPDGKPIFVLSHLPLHYSTRTYYDGDDRYGKYIFDVLNEAGDRGLTIFYLYGHNHSQGFDSYLGGSVNFLTTGDQIWLANPEGSQKDKPTAYNLKFTYMNAGFVGHYVECPDGVDTAMTMSVFEIHEGYVVVKKFDKDDLHVLRSGTGAYTKYKNRTDTEKTFDYTPNTVTYESPQTVKVLSVDLNLGALSGGQIKLGDTVEISVSVNDGQAYKAVWTSSETSAVTVTANAEDSTKATVSAVGAGEATITVTVSPKGTAPDDSGTSTSYTRSFSVKSSATNGVTLVDSGTIYVRQPASWDTTFPARENSDFKQLVEDGAYFVLASGTKGDADSAGQRVILGQGTENSSQEVIDKTITTKTLDDGTLYIDGADISDEYLWKFDNYEDFYRNFPNDKNNYEGYFLRNKTPYAYEGETYYRILFAQDYSYNNITSNLCSSMKDQPNHGHAWWHMTYNLGLQTVGGRILHYSDTKSHFETRTETNLDTRIYLYYPVTRETSVTAYLNQNTGTVRQNADSGETGAYIIIQDGDSIKKIPVELSMLSGEYDTTVLGTYSNLTVTYMGVTISTAFTLEVKTVDQPENPENPENPDNPEYPEYPEEGAVRVSKTGAAVDGFNKTGVAGIELSATGVPMNTGIDVMIVLDMSSSMRECLEHDWKDHNCGSDTRNQALQAALAEMLTILKQPLPDGSIPDIDVAISQFNSYTMFSDVKWLKDENGSDHVGFEHNSGYNGLVQEFTDVNSLNFDFRKLVTESGTNYDVALQDAYTALAAKKKQNEDKHEDREQIVVFMSDGVPFQYNYIGGNSDDETWNHWLQGTMDENNEMNLIPESARNHFYNYDGKHWMAEAIKGDPDSFYQVIWNNNRRYSEVAFSDNDNIKNVAGLGAKIYTIGFSLKQDNQITVETAEHVLKSIATDASYFKSATSADELATVFKTIANDVTYAGENAYFLDTMGPEYDLNYLRQRTTGNGQPVTLSVEPKIEYKEYILYTRSDIGKTMNGVTVTEDMVGQRTGEVRVLETVKFTVDGSTLTGAYSDQINNGTTNILNNGVIEAKNFYYNLSSSTITRTVYGKEVQLAPETFCCLVGRITETERCLSYQVYLTGSVEGTRTKGSYDTNKSATLYYTNYLGNPCQKDTVSPVFPWDSATVSYAFYLVDKSGNPVVNSTTGTTGSFTESVKLTRPVSKEILLNSGDGSESIEAMTLANLPEGYTLFDSGAKYEIQVNSNGGGSWTITVGQNANGKLTTYVTEYGGDPTTHTSSENENGVDYTRTTVWFAVQYRIQTVPDTVVIDYGLPVDIHVLGNDIGFAQNAQLKYIGSLSLFEIPENAKPWEYLRDLEVSQTPAFETENMNGSFGTAKVNDGKIRYTLNKSNGMQMNKEEVFAYAVDYTGAYGTNGYYYSTVTVIPATTIYYEDSFVTFNSFDYATDAEIDSTWTVEGTTQDKVQDEDRPGSGSLSQIDADNLYGTDSAYSEMSTYSLGSAHKVTVKGTTDAKNNVVSGEYATAEFTFCGTGFDVISLTSDKTGTISVKVLDEAGNKVKYVMVDTYYGYKYDAENNKWVVDTTASDTLYQVPVIKVNGLDYGRYTVKITASYLPIYDHGQDGITDTAGRENSYDFYLDAIRIYDPANDGKDNKTIEDAYVADKEGWPEYFELRNLIISKKDFNSNDQNTTSKSGIVFIDNTLDSDKNTTYTIDDYKNYGPNNELYLAKNQAVAFNLNVSGDVAGIQIAMKTVGSENSHAKVFATDNTGCIDQDIKTATDLYYNITTLNGKTVVITNTGDAILSITNVKVTYQSKHTDSIENSYFTATQTGAQAAVMSLRSMAPVEPEPTEPEETAPETTTPEETVPETTAPEETVPETTAPEETVPEETEPEETVPFQPQKLEVRLSGSSVKVGSEVAVTVTSGKDVEYITINGEAVTDYSTNRWTRTRSWKVKLTAETEGELPITVVAYNAEGQASQPVVRTVTVTEKYTSIGNWLENSLLDLIGKLLGKNG